MLSFFTLGIIQTAGGIGGVVLLLIGMEVKSHCSGRNLSAEARDGATIDMPCRLAAKSLSQAARKRHTRPAPTPRAWHPAGVDVGTSSAQLFACAIPASLGPGSLADRSPSSEADTPKFFVDTSSSGGSAMEAPAANADARAATHDERAAISPTFYRQPKRFILHSLAFVACGGIMPIV